MVSGGGAGAVRSRASLLRLRQLQSVSPCAEELASGDNDWLGIQLDEAQARALCVIHYVPLAIVVDAWTMSSLGAHWRKRLWPDLPAVAAHPPVLRRHVESLEAAVRKFDVYVVPAVMQHVAACEGHTPLLLGHRYHGRDQWT
jgi:hypothetical protein